MIGRRSRRGRGDVRRAAPFAHFPSAGGAKSWFEKVFAAGRFTTLKPKLVAWWHELHASVIWSNAVAKSSLFFASIAARNFRIGTLVISGTTCAIGTGDSLCV